MEIRSPIGTTYLVTKDIAKDPRFTLYLCSLKDSPAKQWFLKIAKEKKYNKDLDREGIILNELSKKAAEVEINIDEADTLAKALNYHFYFPKLVESFIAENQEKRRITIMHLDTICNKVSELVPASNILNKDRILIDPKTSVWILGKLLKLLDFTHYHNILVGNLTLSNILVHKKNHYVSIFDWSSAILSSKNISKEKRRFEIITATKSVLRLLGSDSKAQLKPHVQLENTRYEEFLLRLVKGEFYDANVAHQEFYELVSQLWERKYHPFGTY